MAGDDDLQGKLLMRLVENMEQLPAIVERLENACKAQESLAACQQYYEEQLNDLKRTSVNWSDYGKMRDDFDERLRTVEKVVIGYEATKAELVTNKVLMDKMKEIELELDSTAKKDDITKLQEQLNSIQGTFNIFTKIKDTIIGIWVNYKSEIIAGGLVAMAGLSWLASMIFGGGTK